MQDEDKRLAAEAAADMVQDGMTVGLGTGSTANFAIKKLGQRIKEGLTIRGLPTSKASETLAREVGIPIVDFSDVTRLDLTIDGADEMDAALNLVKGGGGALFREKIVAAASDMLVIFADGSKQVDTLGAFPLPVEVNPFGWQVVVEKITALGAKVALRGGPSSPFISDNHGYILDCAFGTIPDPPDLEKEISSIVGVMETGLFIGLADIALVASNGHLERVKPQS